MVTPRLACCGLPSACSGERAAVDPLIHLGKVNAAMATDTTKLITELNNLLRLTHTEILIAETRRAQAGSEAIEHELAANADEGRERVQLITAAIRELGGVPDLLGVATGRVAALAKTQLEQGQQLSEALFGDLALEQQLHARARFLRVLADAASATQVRRVAERLERAHAETIEWLEIRLAEVAVGGPPAIRATPLQTAAGVARRTATLPLRGAATAVNRSLRTLSSARGSAGAAVEEQLERTSAVVDAAGAVYTAGRDAALQQAESEAVEGGARQTADALHATRAAVGSLDVSELPIADYDDLNAATARERIAALTDVHDVEAVLAYEQRHAARRTVIDEAQARLGALARANLDGEQPDAGTDLAELTVDELRDRAQQADIEGRSGMNKQQLIDALRRS